MTKPKHKHGPRRPRLRPLPLPSCAPWRIGNGELPSCALLFETGHALPLCRECFELTRGSSYLRAPECYR